MRLLLLAQGFENGALFGLLVGVGLLLGAGAGAFGFGGSALVGMGCKLRFAAARRAARRSSRSAAASASEKRQPQ